MGDSIHCGCSLGGPSYRLFAIGLHGTDKRADQPFERLLIELNTMIERRRAIRYPLQLPASFSWEDEQGIVRQGEGHTRNISEKGAFVEAAIVPPIGSSVELHFSLPALSDWARKMRVLHTGETIRLEWTEQGERSGGFAITSRETVWRYEDGNIFNRGEKEGD